MDHNTNRHDKWKTHIQAWQNSTLSQKSYCQRHNLCIGTFGYWRRKLRQTEEPQSFLPLAILPEAPKSDPKPVTTLVIRLMNGLAVEVDKDFDSTTLKRLLKVLEHVD